MNVYDVLIIGAGPAGLMSAVALSNQGVKVGILEKSVERPLRGRADGLEPRTLEILNSYGLLDSWWRHASSTVELSVWVCRTSLACPFMAYSVIESTSLISNLPQVATQQQDLQRILRMCNSSQGTSKYHETTMDQAVIEREMEHNLLRYHDVAVQYAIETSTIRLKHEIGDGDDYPIEVTARQHGVPLTLLSKYVIGADGAHSWTRKQAGITMLGSRTCE
jgi:phenol 2-monooxygenase